MKLFSSRLMVDADITLTGYEDVLTLLYNTQKSFCFVVLTEYP